MKIDIKYSPIWFIILLYFLIYYCLPNAIFPFRTHLLLILPTLTLFYVIVINQWKIRFPLISLLMLLMVVNAFITNLINNNTPEFTIVGLLSLFLMTLLIINVCTTKEKLLKLLKILFWMGFIGGGLMGIFQKITGNYFFIDPNDLLFADLFMTTATRANPNYAAMQLVATIFIGIYLRNLNKKIFYDIAVTILFLCAFLTISRTTIFAGLLAIIFLVVLNQKNKIVTKKYIAKLCFGIIGSLFVITLALNLIDSQVNIGIIDWQRISFIKTDDNLSIRNLQWIGSLELISDQNFQKLVYGIGDNYVDYLGEVTGYYMTTHNLPLEVLIKYGVISFILLLSIYALTFNYFIRIFKKTGEFNAFLAGWLAIFICLQMISMMSIDSYMYIAIAVVVKEIVKKDSL